MKKPLPALMLATAILILVACIWELDGETVTAGIFLAVPCVLMAILLRVRPRGLVLTIARGMSAGLIAIILLFVLLTPLVVRNMPAVFSAIAVALLLVQAMIIGLLAPPPEDRKRELIRTSAVAALSFAGILILFYAGMVTYRLGSIFMRAP